MPASDIDLMRIRKMLPTAFVTCAISEFTDRLYRFFNRNQIVLIPKANQTEFDNHDNVYCL